MLLHARQKNPSSDVSVIMGPNPWTIDEMTNDSAPVSDGLAAQKRRTVTKDWQDSFSSYIALGYCACRHVMMMQSPWVDKEFKKKSSMDWSAEFALGQKRAT